MKKYIMFYIPLLLILFSCTKDPMKANFSIQGIRDRIVVENTTWTKEFEVNSNTEWKIIGATAQSWCTITPSHGDGKGKITISVAASSGTARSAAFNITGKGIRSQTIEIQQGEPYSAITTSEFPIIAWTGIEEGNALNKFTHMKNAGINTYLGWYDNVGSVLKVLDQAQQAGVKVITACPELKTDIEQTVNSLKNHPALFGYHLDDEPEVSELTELSNWARQVASVDNRHPVYINIYPNWAWGKEQYTSNLALFLGQAPVPFLSFDNYPIVSINGNPAILRPDWYRNLEEVSSAAKKKGIPFWAFALALSHRLDATHFYPLPTLGELRLQVFSNLAYGAQAIQYFTYHGIYRDNPTEAYERVKNVNQDVHKLTSVFLNATMLDVWHTGKLLPEGTKAIGKLPSNIKSLVTGDLGAVVSLLEKNGNQYLVIVNKDYRESMDLKIEVNNSVSKVSKDGSISQPQQTALSVEPGDMVIYTWKK